MNNELTATLLIHCTDQKGIVVAVTEFIYKNKGNIIRLEQHIDKETNVFFMRVEWNLQDFAIPKNKVLEYFDTLVGDHYRMGRALYFSDIQPRMALFVSKMSHCVYDILSRWQAGEWPVEIPLMISNHDHLKNVAAQFGLDFYHIPVTKDTKDQAEEKQLELLNTYDIDLIVLARYMQVLSPEFVSKYKDNIINIHHSFLPAFPGAKPYHSAYKRGVKIIGATSHYVTSELDGGPIIEQDVVRINHKNTIHDLIRKGQDLEKVVLSRAVFSHLQRKTLVYDNRTIVFD